jgi:Zn-dependent protease with chaperone function
MTGPKLHGKYYNGQFATSYSVSIDCGPDGLHIRSSDTQSTVDALWPLDELKLIERPNPPVPGKIGRLTEPESRLLIDPAADWSALENYLPDHAFETFSLPATWPSIFGYFVLATMAVAGLFFVVPKALEYGAYIMPPAWETRIGEYAIRQVIDAPVCSNQAGQDALNELVKALQDGAAKTPHHRNISYTVYVPHDHATQNALAAPGGYIALFSGAIEAAENPDEIAGILAHEMAHIELHHPMRGIMRDIGLTAGLQLMFGAENPASAALQIAGALHQMRYSREKEIEADSTGHEILLQSGINPQSLGLFLDRLPDFEADSTAGKFFDYLSTHPRTSERLAKLKSLGSGEAARFKPSLSAAQWRALKNICKDTKDLN